ncbi:hypothetical protein [Actinokineospora sp. HUAS TT18]|uniref:hypothetical protein n=1 Tax=Actinokineospora sp. HUAS TT18 TaxID=3447451 RepID=UPI003F52390F
MRRSRIWSVGAVACLVTVLAGCGTDLAKQTFPRSTVPATADLGGGSTDPTTATNGGGGVTGDEAFASKNLRRADPCGLLNEDALAEFGTPANSRLRDYDKCSNYMKDKSGKELNFTLTVGEILTGTSAEGTFKIGGLPATESELQDKTACFTNAITESSPKRAITLQMGGSGGLCEIGRKMLENVVKQVREGAQPLKLAKGTVVDLDPCEILDPSVIKSTIGESAENRLTTLHACSWNLSGASFDLSFEIGSNPDDLADAAETTPVDLGGVKAQKKAEKSSGSDRCRLEWAHAPFPEDRELAEVVSIEFSRYSAQTGEDTCAKVEAVAKALIPKLPTG